jgi:ParB-like chromosome segregation protein Spo0J
MTAPTPSSRRDLAAAAKAGEIAQSVIAMAAGKDKAPRQEAPGITKRTTSYMADPKKITIEEGFNARFDMGDIDGLAAEIKEWKAKDPSTGGLINDLHVKRIPAGDPRLDAGFLFEVRDGHRRLAAIQLLMSKGEVFEVGVPVKIVDKASSKIDDLLLMFVANGGKPFLPLEEAAAYSRLREAGMTVAQICKAVGRKQMHVTSILALADGDESLKQLVKEGKIGKTMAKDIAVNARGDKAKQAELAKEAAEAGGDKKKKRAVGRKVAEARQAKAVRKGKRVPKMRALTDEELNALGAKIGERLPKLIMDAKAMMYEKNLFKWIKEDDKLALAFTYGALQALKSAAGVKVELEV